MREKIVAQRVWPRRGALVRWLRPELLLPLVITTVGLLVRSYGHGSGYPNLLPEGEQDAVGQALQMLATMDPRPDRFFKTATYSYFLMPILAAEALYLFGGFILGFFASPVFLEMWRCFYVARVIGMLFGVATIPLLYLVGKELPDQRVGLLAALFLTFYPTHVVRSQEGTPYTAQLFFALLSFLFISRICKRGKTRDYVLAQLCACFATAIQHNVLFLFVPLCLAHFLHGTGRGHRFRRVLLGKSLYLGLLSVGIGFLVGNPGAQQGRVEGAL